MPGGGWEAWATRGLVAERGAVVRPRCVSLSALLLEVQRAAGGAEAAAAGKLFFDVDAWTLRLAAALGDAGDAAGPLAAWLGRGGDDEDRWERRLQLGRRLAAVLDRCLLTRPGLVEALRDEATPERAEAGDPALVPLLWQREGAAPPERAVARAMGHLAWQARLFGPLLRGSDLGPAGPAYRAVGERLAAERAADGSKPRPHPVVPSRVSVWVLGAVAPAQLDGLEMLDAAGCRVTVLVLSASTQYLADLLPAAWFDDETAAELDDPDMHRERPHPLLAAWGQLTRDRQTLLLEREEGNGAGGAARQETGTTPGLLSTTPRIQASCRKNGGCPRFLCCTRFRPRSAAPGHPRTRGEPRTRGDPGGYAGRPRRLPRGPRLRQRPALRGGAARPPARRLRRVARAAARGRADRLPRPRSLRPARGGGLRGHRAARPPRRPLAAARAARR